MASTRPPFSGLLKPKPAPPVGGQNQILEAHAGKSAGPSISKDGGASLPGVEAPGRAWTSI